MIRPYIPSDKPKLLELLRLNTPQYFAPEEESDFYNYLDQELDLYFVVQENGRIVGSGGINFFPNEKQARLSWDLIHPDYQGQGLGTKITNYRIKLLRQNPAVEQVVVRTSQLVYPFYQKLGFKLERIEKDFWAKGFDLYQMKLVLRSVALQKKI